MDDRLFISQDKSFNISNSHLFCSYHIIFSLLKQFGLVIKYGKMEVFHFSRPHGVFNPPLLDLTTLGGPILHSKETWHYLGFIFNRKLTFQQYINFYANKTISIIKYMKMLGNSSRELIPTQKCLLYALYSFLLWYYNKDPLAYLLKELRKIQWRAAIWILGAFWISPLFLLVLKPSQVLSQSIYIYKNSVVDSNSEHNCYYQIIVRVEAFKQQQ